MMYVGALFEVKFCFTEVRNAECKKAFLIVKFIVMKDEYVVNYFK